MPKCYRGDRYNGKDYGTPYITPEYTGPEPTAEVEGGKLYTGSRHCSAVMACIKTKLLDSTFPDRIVECNCSTCQRVSSSLPPLPIASEYPKADQCG